MVELTATFNRVKSYFPIEGKLTDKFDSNFKLVVEVTNEGATIPREAWGVGMLWKGTVYIFASNDRAFNTPYELVVDWKGEPPMIMDILLALGEELPEETKTYNYAWVTGFFVNKDGVITPRGELFAATDVWNTELLVVVPPFPVDKILMATGVCAILLGAFAIASRREEYART